MKTLFFNSLFLLLGLQHSSANGQNPSNFLGFDLNPPEGNYNPVFDGNLPDPPDTCGLMCRAPQQFPFGLTACLRLAFEEEGVMPRLDLSDDGNHELPKVVFGPSTAMYGSEFNFDEYNEARWGLVSRLPAAVLFAETTADVVAAVNCARTNGYKVSPRGRGHDYNGLSTLEDSLVIDMQLNCKLESFETDKTTTGEHILPGSRYVGRIKAPSGCTNAVFLAAVYNEFKDDGGMTVIGSCPSVGITGYILNGGFGDTSPYCGTAADVVDEIEMVLYNGTTITASATENEDVFWASKGGTGGIGVITHFWARVIQNPSETKKFTAYQIAFSPMMNPGDTEQLETVADILMRWQALKYDDPNGVLVGGGGSCRNLGDGATTCAFRGVFLGTIEEFMTVLSDAQLLDEQVVYNGGLPLPSTATRGRDSVCEDGDKCREEFGEKFPKGLQVDEFDSIAEAAAFQICRSAWGSAAAGWGAWSMSSGNPTYDVCSDLKIPAENCNNETGLLNLETCYTETVNDAMLKAAQNPQGFMNRKGPSSYEIFNSVVEVPDSLTVGTATGGNMGGMMLPELQRDTFRALLSTDVALKWAISHMVHGAPIKVDSNLDLYPFRKYGYLTGMYQPPEWTNALLNDPAFNGDVNKLRIYGNYPPTLRLPNYETHVYGDKAEELSRIRTEYDPLGGFDSPRYVQRNKRSGGSVATTSALIMVSSAIFLALSVVF